MGRRQKMLKTTDLKYTLIIMLMGKSLNEVWTVISHLVKKMHGVAVDSYCKQNSHNN